MKNERLDLINRYFDAENVLLSREEQELLCRVLENRDACDGFVSEVYVELMRSEDSQDPWIAAASHQYKLVFEGSRLRVDSIHKHECEDGYADTAHWDWDNACTTGYKLREVLRCLQVFEWELR